MPPSRFDSSPATLPGLRQIFFDLDGTLVDSFPGIEFSARAAMAETMPGRMPPDYRPFIGPPIREIFRRALTGAEAADLDDLEAAFRRSYDNEGWRRTTLYPGVAGALRQLSALGVVCHVLTNKPRPPTLRILDYLGIGACFSEIITPEFRTPPYTTKLEAALDARRRHALAPHEAVVVGDSPDDAAAAAGCGFGFVAVSFGYGGVHQRTEPAQPLCIDAFSQLLDFLPPRPQPPAHHETIGQP